VKSLQTVVVNDWRAIREVNDFSKRGGSCCEDAPTILVKVTGFLLYRSTHLPTAHVSYVITKKI